MRFFLGVKNVQFIYIVKNQIKNFMLKVYLLFVLCKFYFNQKIMMVFGLLGVSVSLDFICINF